MMIIWDQSMSTGVKRLDSQHKVLFEKFNELELAFSANDTAKITRAVGEFLDFMQFYAAWHFKQEEECMHQYAFPIAAVNKNLHAVFIERFNEFYTRWQQGERNLDLARETYTIGATWLKNHVMGIDIQLRDSIRK
jgi:hemerythrin-like metal-binding protein